MALEERIENLRKELNLAILNTELLVTNEIVNLSQQVDELIVMESKLRLNKYISLSK